MTAPLSELPANIQVRTINENGEIIINNNVDLLMDTQEDAMLSVPLIDDNIEIKILLEQWDLKQYSEKFESILVYFHGNIF